MDMSSDGNRRPGYLGLLVFEGGLEGLEFHPIANAFPLMEGREFEELAEDIKKNGQQQPILTYEGKILDGRNRYRACLEAGEEPWTEPWQGKSPVEAVLSLNLHRRHLSSSQRAVIAERMLPHLEEEAKRRRAATLKQNVADTQRIGERTEGQPLGKELPNGGRDAGKAVEQAARLTGTNRQYVSDAKRLAREAPEDLAKVERGEVSLPAAVRARRPEKPLKGEDRRPAREVLKGEEIDLPPWDPPPEQKAFRAVIGNLVKLSKLDPEEVAAYCEDEWDAGRRVGHARAVRDWFGRYEEALEKRRRDLGPGLRAVK